MRYSRRLLVVGLAALAAIVVMTWYARLQRCQAELAAWAQLRAALIASGGERILLEEARQDPVIWELLDAAGVLRTEAGMKLYCDTPIWNWWR